MSTTLERLKSWIKNQVDNEGTRDAARFALQSAAAAAAAFVFMQALELPEKFVAIISAVLVVQPSVGGTAGEARERLVATMFGSAIGVICLAVLPRGFGTAAALAVAMLVVNWIAAFRPGWRYGVVAAVALALGSTENTIDTATNRGIAIGLGVVIGMASSFLIWPDSARSRARRYAQSALKKIDECLDGVIDKVVSNGQRSEDQSRKRFHQNIENALDATRSIHQSEVDDLHDYIKAIEHLYNSILIVDRAENHSDSSSEEDEDFFACLREFRENARHVIKGITANETELADRLEKLKAIFDIVKDRVTMSHINSDGSLAKTALVFGLGEILQNLEAVADISSRALECDTGVSQVANLVREAVPTD